MSGTGNFAERSRTTPIKFRAFALSLLIGALISLVAQDKNAKAADRIANRLER